MLRKNWKLSGLLLPLLAYLLLAPAALAQPASSGRPTFELSRGIVGNLAPKCSENGNCDFCDFIDLFIVLQKVILSLFGGLALIMLVWAGQSIIMAGGAQEKITAAKKLITSTLLGVLTVLAGYVLVMFLITILISPTNSQPGGNATFKGPEFWRAYCKTLQPGDPDYCKSVPAGTACDEGMVCWNQDCTRPTCAALGQLDPINNPSECAPTCRTGYGEYSDGYCGFNDTRKCCIKGF